VPSPKFYFVDFIDALTLVVFRIGVAVCIVFGLCVLGYQIFLWAKSGLWTAMPLSEAFSYFGIDLSPIYHAQDWKGLASLAAWLLDTLPLSLVVPAGGLFAYVAVAVWLDNN
jgi:hypothetical protein